MNTKKIVAAVGVSLLFIILVYGVTINKKEEKQKYIFDKNDNVSFSEVKKAHRKIKFTRKMTSKSDSENKNESEINISDYFTSKNLNPYTGRYFKHIQNTFKKSKNLDEHLVSVMNYLKLQMEEDEAEKIFEIYKNYLNCEIELVKEMQTWGTPENGDEIIENLSKVFELRKQFMGPEIAESIFAAEVKAKEYAVRRSVIVADNDLYGAEKEEIIESLNNDMWGSEKDEAEGLSNPYNKYREKIEIYKKDLEEFEGEEDKDQLIKEIRNKIFEPEIVAQLEKNDEKFKLMSENENNYRAKENETLNNTDLSTEEKNEILRTIQDEMFGEEAEAFRRREAMRKGLSKKSS